MKQSKGEKIFAVFNIGFLIIIAVVAIYPFIYVLSASLSDPQEVMAGNVWLLPSGFELGAYKEVINYKGIWRAYGNTIFYAGVGMLVSMAVTLCGAYPLSKKRLRGGVIITFLVAFTMWFSAGMIPVYLNLKSMNLLDTRSALIFGFCVTPFYVFVLRTYFSSIPDSLEESAKIDGVNDFVIFWKIYMPLSKPCLITVALYYMVDRWNSYFWAMLLLKDETKIPLQVILNKLIVQSSWTAEMGAVDTVAYNEQTLIYSTIVISIVPMLLAYPFAQKYFIKGIMVGSIKG